MLPLNVPLKLPGALKWYALVKVALIFFLVTSPLLLISNKSMWFNVYLLLMLFIGLPLWIYDVLSYRATSVTVGENVLTINAGIIFKRSTAIAYNQVQSATANKGPLASLFGISRLNVWTASPSQIVIQDGNSANRPIGALWLQSANSEWLKNFILSKHS